MREWTVTNQKAGTLKRQDPKERARLAANQRERYRTDTVYRERMLETNRVRRRKESAKVKQRANENARARQNPQYKTRKCLASRVSSALKGTAKAATTMELVGCSATQLAAHLESLWLPGMDWTNHSKQGWHIDHILPCAAFDLTKPEEQRKCFHYTNLQPLWAFDNISKHDWVPDYQI